MYHASFEQIVHIILTCLNELWIAFKEVEEMFRQTMANPLCIFKKISQQ